MDPKRSIKPAFEESVGDPNGTKFPALRKTMEGASQKGHVLLGEPHAEDMSLNTYRFMANNPDMFRTMAANGVKHLVLEFPNELEEKLTPFMKGDISRDQLRQSLFEDPDMRFDNPWTKGNPAKTHAFNEAFVQTIDNARAAGMRVHFADVTSGKYVESAQELSEALSSGKMSSDAVLDKAAEMAWDRYDDVEQHNFLRGRIPMGDKIMGCFGVAHLSLANVPLNGIQSFFGNPKGIAQRLRDEEGIPVTTVGLWANKAQQDMVLKGVVTDGIVKGMKGPDVSIHFDTKEVESNTLTRSASPIKLAYEDTTFPSPGFAGK